MKIKEIFPLLPLVVFFLATIASCGKGENKVKTPSVNSVQVLSLKMSSKDLPELSKTFFSIDHRKGEIFNAQPLPYLSDFEQVKLEIKTLSTNQIKIFVGDGEREQKADSVNLKGWQKGVRIDIQNKEKTMQKSYRVVIKRYDYDPLLFEWKNLGTSLLPEATELLDRSLSVRGEEVFLAYHFADKTTFYKATKGNPTAWQDMGSASIAVNRFYALTADLLLLFDKNNELSLYNLETATTQPLKLALGEEVKVAQVMGLLPIPESNLMKLCLVVNKGKDSFFATAEIDPTKETLISQKIGYPLTPFFPYTIFDSKEIVEARYPKLIAMGGRTELNPSDARTISLWSTTTGLDWLTFRAKEVSVEIPHTDYKPTLLFDSGIRRYYLYMPISSDGYHVYYSDDGAVWKEGDKNVMLHLDGDEVGGRRDMLGYSLENHRVVLLGGKDASGKWIRTIWEGYPKIYEEN